jgi:hypothetical protein
MERNKDIVDTNDGFRRTGSEKAGQLAPSSPYDDSSRNTQADAADQSADNDGDRLPEAKHNLQKDAEEAQSDGNLSFPEGK